MHWLDRLVPSSRAIDVVEHLGSVLLAILFAHLAGVANVNWAAFAGYMVMRGQVAATLARGLLRVAGTVAGGVLALACVPLVLHSWALQAAAVLVVGSVFLYEAIVGRRSYAWLFAGLTFAMVLFDKLEQPSTPLAEFVRVRVIDTGAGTLACVTVSLLAAATLRRLRPAPAEELALVARWHPHAARHAAQGGVALAILAGLAALVPIPGLAQAPVTIMAAMLVPVDSIGASGLAPVSRRVVHRLVGCAAGAVLAGGVLLAAHVAVPGRQAPVLLAGTSVGVVLGRIVETGPRTRRYVGTQFALAVLVALVPDRYADMPVDPAWHRLLGIVAGMVVLEPVLLVWHWASPLTGRWARPVKAEPAGAVDGPRRDAPSADGV